MEDFETDSFVVTNSDVEYASSLDELDLVDEFGSEDDKKKRKKLKQRKPPSSNSCNSFFNEQ